MGILDRSAIKYAKLVWFRHLIFGIAHSQLRKKLRGKM